ncbi:hypothetical protein OBBRIDRAFT_810346 [Obba rivulosa]|uniref:Small ribosomal subunit protein mS35 mitochondrial conserved domain-containing protein n=1 Tax=Obba rivulosa TaxID=1052685 RepID=A0A8E2DS83_9APHY|nr:hypothetical protein OBBRIDRAFT_810346 [Obba rivulosa]
MDDLEDAFSQDDTPAAGHIRFQQQRQQLYYKRLIEHEMPKLVAYRKPFVPPDASKPLIVRTVSYGGEEHPAAAKRTIVVSVSQLPLRNEVAIHKIKLLAGPRWSPEPPKDSGVGVNEKGQEHGFIKISCEDFPEPAMNLKWVSDTLDRLLAEANDSKDTFADLPLDTRHIDAKIRKAKKGGHIYGRGKSRPSLKDFPKEWLPVAKVDSTAVPSSAQ